MDKEIWAKRATILSTVLVVSGVLLFLYGKFTSSVSFSLLVTSELLTGAGLLVIGIVMIRTNDRR